MSDRIVQLKDRDGNNIFPVSSTVDNSVHYVDPEETVIPVTGVIPTATDPGEGSSLSQNTLVAVYDGDYINPDYSTSEIETGGYWIDGKKIYKKTVSCGALPNATSKNVAHDIQNLDIVVDYTGIAYNADKTSFIVLPYVYPGTIENIKVSLDSSYVQISTGIDRTSFANSYVTIYYTKTS